MATNKHAIIRYRTIDRCLRDRNGVWNWKSLAAVCSEEILASTGEDVSLSERTIKGDISSMRSNEILGYYAPIEYDRKEKSYYYSDAKYSLMESPINPNDKRVLERALAVLRQFAGFKEMMGIQNIITKLQHSIDYRNQDFSPIISFDHPIDAPGQEWLYLLYQGVIDRQCLVLSYKAFGKTLSSYQISPYLLKEYQKRWYLIGFVHKRGEIRTFALDRIEDIRESLDAYLADDDFDGQKYFNDIVGITLDKSKKREEVEFEAYGLQINYFITRPLHKSQMMIWRKKESARFRIDVIINYELVSELFSYRNNVKVISPNSLVREMRNYARKLAQLY